MIHIEESKKEVEISGTLEEMLNDFGNVVMGIHMALAEDMGAEAAGDILRLLFAEALRHAPENYSRIKFPVKDK